MLLRNKFIPKIAGGRIEHMAAGFVSAIQMRFLRMHKDPDILDQIAKLQKKMVAPLTSEAFLIYSVAVSLANLPGDFAEVGTFQGGSAYMMCLGKGQRTMRVFDTFSGLPEGHPEHGDVFRRHMYSCSREEVERNLSPFSDLQFYEGVFPESTLGVEDLSGAQYAFVNVDVDLYKGTLECLKYFYPRLTPGGIFISHDYWLEGVKNAVRDYLADKQEKPIDLPTTQCMFVKL